MPHTDGSVIGSMHELTIIRIIRKKYEQQGAEPPGCALARHCKLDDCIRRFDMNSSGAAHALIHIWSEAPFMRYSSKAAVAIIVEQKQSLISRRMRELVGACARMPLCAALCQYIQATP
jgi:hypothetical protein